MTRVHGKLLLTAIFWGGTFIAGRSIAGHVGPFSAAFLRFTIASLFLLATLLKIEGRFPAIKKNELTYVLLLGMTGVFSYNLFFFKGLSLIQAGRASLIIANNPIAIALLSAVLFHEKLSPVKLMGIVLSVTGAVIAISRGNPLALMAGGIGRGDVYILLCVLSWVAYTLIGKQAMYSLPPVAAVTYSAVAGAALLLVPALREGLLSAMKTYSLADWISICYLGLFGTVLAFIWYYQGISKIGAGRAGLFINFVPISAILLAFFILDEPITLSLGVGACLVIIGVYLTNSDRLFGSKRIKSGPDG